MCAYETAGLRSASELCIMCLYLSSTTYISHLFSYYRHTVKLTNPCGQTLLHNRNIGVLWPHENGKMYSQNNKGKVAHGKMDGTQQWQHQLLSQI